MIEGEGERGRVGAPSPIAPSFPLFFDNMELPADSYTLMRTGCMRPSSSLFSFCFSERRALHKNTLLTSPRVGALFSARREGRCGRCALASFCAAFPGMARRIPQQGG